MAEMRQVNGAATSLLSLKRMCKDFREAKAKLALYLSELTTDGAGHLYDLKVCVGPSTDLGNTISALGGAVVNASDSCIKALNDLIAKMEAQIAENEKASATAGIDYSQVRSEISAITFES